MSTMEIKRELEGRCGTDLRPVYLVSLNGVEVGFSKRLWVARALVAAISGGHIEPTGDTTARLAQWAAKNDPELWRRMIRVGE